MIPISTLLKDAPFVPVVTIDNLESAIPLATALHQGGIKVIEIALRTDCAFEAISAIRKACPDLIVGAATIMTVSEMDRAIAAGAQFGASPMFDPDLLNHAKEQLFTYLPCATNLSEINQASKAGYKIMKLFPMDGIGDNEHGEKFLRGNCSMFKKLQVAFYTSCLETSVSNLGFLKYPCVISVASGWSTPIDLVTNKKWSEITEKARLDILQAEQIRKSHLPEPDTKPKKPFSSFQTNTFKVPTLTATSFKAFSSTRTARYGVTFFAGALTAAAFLKIIPNAEEISRAPLKTR